MSQPSQNLSASTIPEPSLGRPEHGPRDGALDHSDHSNDLSIKRHSTYWFEDGNIILSVQDTLYRVHRGFIGHHSTVLSELFNISNPPTANGGGPEIVEGCKVINLSGDRATDWNILFSVLYDHNTEYRSLKDFRLPLITAILRLGKKYRVDSLYKVALGRLALTLPTTLDGWTAMPDDHSNSHEFFRRYSPFELLTTVAQIGLERYLPIALYYCVTEFTLGHIMTFCLSFSPTTATTKWMEILKKLVTGYEKLREAIVKNKFSWHSSPPTAISSEACKSSCTDPIKCAKYREKIASKFCQQPQISLALLFWGDASTQIFMDMKSLDLELCRSCTCEAGRAFNEGRVIVWNNLPLYFGLSSWDNLEDPMVSL